MSRDTSLNDFETSEANDESDGSDDAEPESDGETESLVGTDEDIEPARATYDWTSDGVACEDCGESVETRWRNGDGMVCSDCKEW